MARTRPILSLACAALMLCAVKVMSPSFVSAPPAHQQMPSLHHDAVIKEELSVQPLEMAKQLTPAAVQSAALSTAFALMAEPALAAEPGSYDIREEQARTFMVVFSLGSFLVAAGVVFVISKMYD
eukprot:symbB.v1.2.030117.t1/scaffold3359.1/size58481/2